MPKPSKKKDKRKKNRHDPLERQIMTSLEKGVLGISFS
jgi:hypothetical protein